MIYKMCTMALMTAVICILAPLSIPIGTVPISFTNLAILFTLYLLGWKMGTASSVLYILIGLIGLPVFSGFTGGIGKLAGPTGGYIIGFIPMAIIAGIVIEKTNNIFLQYLSMVIGTIVLYAIGTAWFCVVMDTTVMTALSICVFVFI
ncbi:MAG: biotin transporter BioY, partial [Agathobacter sp.]|nr:biotin transporter BioY [Agathobacter sp.]